MSGETQAWGPNFSENRWLNHTAFDKEGEPVLTRYAVGLMSRSQTLDISKARATLGYTPKITLEDGFTGFAEWWRENTPATNS